MKIAVVHNVPAGGMKRALYEQVKRLAKKHTIDVYALSCADETFLSLKPYARRYSIYRYDPPEHFPKSVASIYFQLPKVYKEMAVVINAEKYDVALVNPCFLTQSPYILRYLTMPTLYQCPEPKREFYEKMPRVGKKWTYLATLPFRIPIKFIDRANARKATMVFVHSMYSQKRVKDSYGIDAFVNYLGVDPQHFRNTETSREKMILTVGDLSLHKGYDFLIRSVGKIPIKERPRLLAVGHSGSERGYIEKLAKESKVQLTVYKNLGDAELVHLYNKAGVFAYAPHNEPFGLVILEAAACGLEAVAVGEGGVPELIDDPIVGRIVRRDEKEFAQVLQEVLDKKEKSDSRSKRSEYVQKKWNWEKSVGELERLLTSVTSDSSTSGESIRPPPR